MTLAFPLSPTSQRGTIIVATACSSLHALCPTAIVDSRTKMMTLLMTGNNNLSYC